MAVLIILFQFFGYKLIVGLGAILVVLLVLVYFNQNKILYIPRIPKFMQSSPGLDFLRRTTQLAGGILPNRAASRKTWKLVLQTDLNCEDGC